MQFDDLPEEYTIMQRIVLYLVADPDSAISFLKKISRINGYSIKAMAAYLHVDKRSFVRVLQEKGVTYTLCSPRRRKEYVAAQLRKKRKTLLTNHDRIIYSNHEDKHWVTKEVQTNRNRLRMEKLGLGEKSTPFDDEDG
jgi:hypothetical protein